MSKVAVGKPLPDFTAVTAGGERWRLADARGKKLVLFFYPRDMTSGCTIEAQNFRDAAAAFRRARAAIAGVSRDSCASHVKFIQKERLTYDLLSDGDEQLCRLFDVIKEKNMYGKKVFGIERSTFLIDAKGVLAREWRKVKIDGHVEEVLEAAKSL